ncbi:hypothetical protein GCM10010195_58420 [Kitasatospora griseola]|nr:hypothetical protein GCM10010195_58420 [Kitasatospora griseola]
MASARGDLNSTGVPIGRRALVDRLVRLAELRGPGVRRHGIKALRLGVVEGWAFTGRCSGCWRTGSASGACRIGGEEQRAFMRLGFVGSGTAGGWGASRDAGRSSF